ncbi:hypothetical protein EDD15DRAFT_2183216 [Pisolithus albus]|nr:hypothetical protein EDD15DRAFT_2183216 [Pisolithus albus]
MDIRLTVGIGYLSDLSADDSSESESETGPNTTVATATGSCQPPERQPLKKQKLDAPSRIQREWRKAEHTKSWMDGLLAIEKLLKSKTTHFVGGPSGLQAKRTRAIASYLALVVRKNRCRTVASQLAAESHGFARMWGGRQVRNWANTWISRRTLPLSLTGRHTKTYSLLSDPGIATELRTYMRSNKWAINPEKLTALTKNQLIPAEAEKYVQQITANEMPNGLRQYMELELFPRVHLKVSKGISLATALQSHDATSQYWVFDNEYRLQKKGAGRGIHRSDVICSTVGHLVEAGQSLEYGKNYDGYWNGELFVNQLKEKIIPAFERIHGAGYQALFFIDNSQGHSAYAEDALLASRMNVNPGGKQPRMRDGWYQKDGVTVVQKMVFSQDHPMHTGEPKGIKAILLERKCWNGHIRGKCPSRCNSDATVECCNKRILECQPDFQEQKSLVQETIEGLGHLCIFLPKFHCELNFIEFFWGKVKKYIRDTSGKTF